MKLTIYGIFIASFFLGENATIPAFVLSHQGVLNVWTVVIATYLASLCADIFWYGVCYFFFRKFDLEKWYNKTHISNQKIYRFILDKHVFVSVTFIKFLIGLRLILTLALILIKKFSFKKYLIFSILSNLFLVAGLFIIGILISYGINVLPVYRGISGITTIIIVSIVAANILPIIVKSYLGKNK